MARRFTSDKLVVASHNAGKAREIVDLLKAFPVQVISAAELNLPEPEETGVTYEENAILKAVAATNASGLPALADDSGVSVDALGGAPGIYSARWAGPAKDFSLAMTRVEQELDDKGVSNARAHFICVLALAWPDGHVEHFRGDLPGHLAFPPRGKNGFGYDPIFIPDGYTETCGEMTPALKHAISHRARAFRQLVDACFQ
jgi:XTP/dITP diphosphohydrolase